MGECSFFYDDMGDRMRLPQSHEITPPPEIDGSRSTTTIDENNDNEPRSSSAYYADLFEHHPHRNWSTGRKVDPCAMARAIKNRAGRQWTE